ncbi:MAG: hypothetical protein SPL80_03890 [Bacilli bacterium]|nr:hypothetical protein [Bacilli bacterium]
MKYVIRKGMFETNSSSTHQMILSVNGLNENGEEAQFPFEEYWDELSDEDNVRYIKSKKRKGLILYQFKYFDAIADHYGNLKDYFSSLAERDLDFFDDGLSLEALGQKLYRLAMFKSVLQEKVPEITIEELREIENEAPGYNAACNACFWNDVLDVCTCGMSYRHICHRFHINAEDFDEEKKLIERFLEDDVVLIVKETWMGGMTFDIPKEL